MTHPIQSGEPDFTDAFVHNLLPSPYSFESGIEDSTLSTGSDSLPATAGACEIGGDTQ